MDEDISLKLSRSLLFTKTMPIALAAVLLVTSLIVADSAQGATPNRPNILVVMTDDLRIGMLGSEGHPYLQTPNLDRFAAEGVEFTSCYAPTPVCGPSRASIFTGQHTSMHMRRDNFYYPDSYEHYLPQHFKDGGYRSALIGKYYEGKTFEPSARKAWDRWFVNKGPDETKWTKGMSEDEWWNEFLYTDQNYSVDGETELIRGHQTDILFDEAARFTSASSDQPFFVFLSPFSPHSPLNMTERNRGRYQGKGVPPRANHQLDQGFFSSPRKASRVLGTYESYCEMIADIDDAMGRLFASLEESGQLDNTMIIFTSDNGLVYGEHGFAWKRHAWEESTKVPFFIRYPKLAKPGTACDALVCLSDIFFTCADVAGISLPSIEHAQGTSIVPLLSGQPQVRERLISMQYEMTDKDNPWLSDKVLWATIQRPDGWKFTTYSEPPVQRPETQPVQMFNLREDELEMNNLGYDPKHTELRKTLRATLKSELARLGATHSWLTLSVLHDNKTKNVELNHDK